MAARSTVCACDKNLQKNMADREAFLILLFVTHLGNVHFEWLRPPTQFGTPTRVCQASRRRSGDECGSRGPLGTVRLPGLPSQKRRRVWVKGPLGR